MIIMMTRRRRRLVTATIAHHHSSPMYDHRQRHQNYPKIRQLTVHHFPVLIWLSFTFIWIISIQIAICSLQNNNVKQRIYGQPVSSVKNHHYQNNNDVDEQMGYPELYLSGMYDHIPIFFFLFAHSIIVILFSFPFSFILMFKKKIYLIQQ